MKNNKVLFLLLVAGLALTIPGGCGKKGGEKVSIKELGFSMHLPEGWKADSKDPYFFYEKEDMYNNFGDVMNMPADGKTLLEFVDGKIESEMKMEVLGEKLLSNVAGVDSVPRTEIVSRNSLQINKIDAVETVIKREGHHIFSVWLPRGKDVVRVSFQVLDEKFPGQEASIRTATRSIEMK